MGYLRSGARRARAKPAQLLLDWAALVVRNDVALVGWPNPAIDFGGCAAHSTELSCDRIGDRSGNPEPEQRSAAGHGQAHLCARLCGRGLQYDRKADVLPKWHADRIGPNASIPGLSAVGHAEPNSARVGGYQCRSPTASLRFVTQLLVRASVWLDHLCSVAMRFHGRFQPRFFRELRVRSIRR